MAEVAPNTRFGRAFTAMMNRKAASYDIPENEMWTTGAIPATEEILQRGAVGLDLDVAEVIQGGEAIANSAMELLHACPQLLLNVMVGIYLEGVATGVIHERDGKG